MHRPIPEQWCGSSRSSRSFFAYHAVSTNFRALLRFRAHIKNLWLRTPRRRSQKDQANWERIAKLADDFLPQPRILHPWPNLCFAVTHLRGGRRMRESCTYEQGGGGRSVMSVPIAIMIISGRGHICAGVQFPMRLTIMARVLTIIEQGRADITCRRRGSGAHSVPSDPGRSTA